MGEHLVESESDNDGDSWTHVSSGESEPEDDPAVLVESEHVEAAGDAVLLFPAPEPPPPSERPTEAVQGVVLISIRTIDIFVE